MSNKDLEKKLIEQQKIIDDRKKKIKEQNESAKKRWDTVSCRLPKGTKERIRAQGLKVNGLINRLVLAELDRLESIGPETEPDENTTAQTEPQPQRAEQPNSQNNNGGSVLLPIEDKESEYERICAEYGGYEIVLHYSTQMELMEKYDFDGIKRLCNYAQSKTTK